VSVTNTFSGKAAVVGIGATEFSKDSGRSELSLACEATLAALEDAGLEPGDVDGMSAFRAETNPEIQIARSLGFGDLRFLSRIDYGGGAACATVHHAAMAVATGAADVVVCYRAFNERSGRRFGTGVQDRPPAANAENSEYVWYSPFGLLTPAQWVAMYATRYLHEYGATSEDLGRVAVAGRAFAATNPKAWFYEQPITLEDHQSSRWIVEPLHLLDCCQESDGGQAVVVTSVERARDLKHPPAVISASAQSSPEGQEMMTSYYREPITAIPEYERVGEQLYATAGIGPDDISTAVFYDAFSLFVLCQVEEFGFCERGDAKDFVRDGHLTMEGRLPTNTHGGQLGEAYIHGMNGIAEGVRQVRGTSCNQVPDVENVLVTAGTGIPTSGLILRPD
jgi:acetyl-CoA acetyltransferase